MSDVGEILPLVRGKLAKARLIAQYREGNLTEAFRSAVHSDPQLAAAFATDTAEGLRNSLLPSVQKRRAAILLQAVELMRRAPGGNSRERAEAIAWLLAETTVARQRQAALETVGLIIIGLAALGGLVLLAFS